MQGRKGARPCTWAHGNEGQSLVPGPEGARAKRHKGERVPRHKGERAQSWWVVGVSDWFRLFVFSGAFCGSDLQIPLAILCMQMWWWFYLEVMATPQFYTLTLHAAIKLVRTFCTDRGAKKPSFQLSPSNHGWWGPPNSTCLWAGGSTYSC